MKNIRKIRISMVLIKGINAMYCQILVANKLLMNNIVIETFVNGSLIFLELGEPNKQKQSFSSLNSR